MKIQQIASNSAGNKGNIRIFWEVAGDVKSSL